ncbi:MAG: hypothetical protein JNM50_08285 [Chromatiales bacterium]|jgi:hypothetical protein|nr:hypothetical protein [Chromatiales bacterium]
MTLEARLAAIAAAGQTITYGDLARELGLRVADLTARLEQLMEEDARAGKPLRAAVLRQRLSPGQLPAPGFFEKAAALGYQVSDGEAFAKDQRRRLYRSG